MNILKNVMNKIAESDKKTELASQKVELALIDDLSKQYNKTNSSINVLKNDLQQLEQAKKRAKEVQKELFKNFEKFNELNIKGERAAKELGLDWKYDKEYKELYKKSQEVMTKNKKEIGN